MIYWIAQLHRWHRGTQSGEASDAGENESRPGVVVNSKIAAAAITDPSCS